MNMLKQTDLSLSDKIVFHNWMVKKALWHESVIAKLISEQTVLRQQRIQEQAKKGVKTKTVILMRDGRQNKYACGSQALCTTLPALLRRAGLSDTHHIALDMCADKVFRKVASEMKWATLDSLML